MQLPIVTNPYSWPGGIVRGGAASQQEDAVDEGGGWGQSVLSVNSWWGEGWSRRKKGGSCRFKSYCSQRSGSGSQVKHTVSACQQANSKGVLSCFKEYRVLCKMCACCLHVWCVVLWDFCVTQHQERLRPLHVLSVHVLSPPWLGIRPRRQPGVAACVCPPPLICVFTDWEGSVCSRMCRAN